MLNEMTGSEPEPIRCSARGCRASATVALHWRNPALHDHTRTKTWSACSEHEPSLADFLDRRKFLLDREPLGE
jgi:hypothetical protein